MLLRESIELFLEQYHRGKAELPAKPAKLRKELKRFLRHCEAQSAPCQTADLSGEIVASYLSDRTRKASGRPRKSTVLALRVFFEFLRREKLVETALAAFLPAHTATKNKADNLLHQLQALEENLLTELNDLTKNVTRLGKEQYKVQTAIDAKQQREAVFFEELQRRLARYERLLEDLSGLKQELTRQISLEIIKDLLPVIDGLENAIALSASLNGKIPAPVHAKTGKNFLRRFFAPRELAENAAPMDVQHWVAGMEIIRDRLLALFKKSGVTPIPSLGEKFDPQLHLTVAGESHNGIEPNAILKEQLRGYRRGEEIVRFAEVVVAK